MVKKPLKPAEFEHALQQLNTLVTEMEKGGLTLEQSLEHFERGINLTRQCQKALQAAEQKVQILMKKEGQDVLATYQNIDIDDDLAQ